jgi:hypothetical protein
MIADLVTAITTRQRARKVLGLNVIHPVGVLPALLV